MDTAAPPCSIVCARCSAASPNTRCARPAPTRRKPQLVAPQMPVLDLPLQMRQAHIHLALVSDECGGVDGLVPIEDLVETLVGDISDEHDEVQPAMVVERADGPLDVNARLPV